MKELANGEERCDMLTSGRHMAVAHINIVIDSHSYLQKTKSVKIPRRWGGAMRPILGRGVIVSGWLRREEEPLLATRSLLILQKISSHPWT